MKTIFKICMVSAVLVLAACSKTPDPVTEPEVQQQTDPRDAFVGDYRMAVAGDVNATLSVPILSINRDGSYPMDEKNIPVRIEKMNGSPDSVIVIISVENRQQETHGEVIGTRLLLQPTKIKIPLSELLDNADLGLDESIKETIRPFATGELELRLYHSPAALADSVLTLTSDVEAEVANAYFSFEMSGTLNDRAVKSE